MEEIRNLRELLYKSAEKFSERTAFLWKNEKGEVKSVTYGQFKSDAEALAKALIKKGYKDKKIALCGKNSYEWCLCYLAVVSFVGVVVPLDKELPGDELMNVLQFSECDAFIGDKNALSKVNSVGNELFMLSMENDLEALISEGESLGGELLPEKVDEEKMSVLLFTSGTTGVMKGVMLSQRNICSDLMGVYPCIEANENDRSLSVLPLHHTYECIAFLMIIYCGGSIAFSGGIRTLKDDFASFRPTVLVCVPLLLERFHKLILKKMTDEGKRKKAQLITGLSGIISEENRRKIFSDIHSFFGERLRKIVVGAAALSEEIAKDFSAFGFKLIIGYGLTECSPIVICNTVKDITLNSIGKPLSNVQVKIEGVSEDGVGEICVKGPMVMLGYYKNKEETDKVMKNGWFYTGDLGYKDRYGNYRITGRSKNVIVTRNGKNVYPEELEFYLLKHSVIKEVVVTSEIGDIITAHIFPDENEIAKKLRKDTVTSAEIKKAITQAIRDVNKRIPSYKNIRDTVIRKEEFSKTTTHKIKRHQ